MIKRFRLNGKRAKRGAVIETALFLMTLVILLSAMLVSVSVLSSKYRIDTLNSVSNKANLTTAVHQYVCWRIIEPNQNALDDNFTITHTVDSENYLILSVISSASNKLVATVTIDINNNSNGYTVIDWRY